MAKARAARAGTVVKVGPSKDVVRLSEELEALLAVDQLRRKAPKGMAKCPLCGVILVPTRNRRVRTHDNPVKGARCDASKQPLADFPAK
ncbi:MAG: hypothetical protein AABY18_05675 [Candidatus Thermoplasmatota archaeon]